MYLIIKRSLGQRFHCKCNTNMIERPLFIIFLIRLKLFNYFFKLVSAISYILISRCQVLIQHIALKKLL